MRENIGIFFGGRSCEHDISVLTAMQAVGAIDGTRYNVFPIYMNGEWYCDESLTDLDEYRPFCAKRHDVCVLEGERLFKVKKKGKKTEIAKLDCALLCTHGGEGENGALQGFLEVNGLAYTSCDVTASALCIDKHRFKQTMCAMRQKTVPYLAVSEDDFFTAQTTTCGVISSKVKFPLVVKPAYLGSSIGITFVKGESELKPALSNAFAFGNKVVVERAVTNKTELNVAALEYEKEILISAIESPKSSGEWLTFDDKYMGSKSKTANPKRELPAKIPQELAERVRKTTSKLYKSLGLFGVVRMDYLYDNETDELFINEVNTIPGSMAAYLFEPCGITFSNLLNMLITSAKERKRHEDSFVKTFDSGVILSGNVKK